MTSQIDNNTQRRVSAGRVFGNVAAQSAKRIDRLIGERIEVDWVTDPRDPQWQDAVGTPEMDSTKDQFVDLNEQIKEHVKAAAVQFKRFFESGAPELSPFGLTVKVSKPRFTAIDPQEWVSPVFTMRIKISDSQSGVTVQHNLQIDARKPVSVATTGSSASQSFSFMAYNSRDADLTASDMFIQMLYPSKFYKPDEIRQWKRDRMETVMPKQAFIDAQEMASHFTVGDTVHYVSPLKMNKVPYVGIVGEVHEGIGFVDVYFPWGNERISPEFLMKAASGKKALAGKLAQAYQRRLTYLSDTASGFADAGITQMDAYDMFSRRYHRAFTDSDIKGAIRVGYNDTKVAMYWKQKGRQYVPTQSELNSGCFTCPRCKHELEQTIYKKRTKLHACRECLFLIKQDDILDSLDQETRKEVEKSLGWEPEVSDPAKAFNDLL